MWQRGGAARQTLSAGMPDGIRPDQEPDVNTRMAFVLALAGTMPAAVVTLVD